jgi:hypothetical protein
MTMVAEDIVDFLNTKHPHRNWGFDTIRWISSAIPVQFRFDNLNNLHNAFRNLGTCKSKTITKADDIDQLLDYYMLRYKDNADGINGPGIDGSINYLFKEKMDEVSKELESNAEFKKTHEIIKSLENNGLYDDIEIVIAFDTFIKKRLIVDGTNRSLALYYIKTKSKSSFKELLKSKNHIRLVTLKSSVCRVLFPIDFCKLVQKM